MQNASTADGTEGSVKRNQGRSTNGTRKKAFTLVMSQRARAGLEAEAGRLGISMASVLEMYCRELARKNASEVSA